MSHDRRSGDNVSVIVSVLTDLPGRAKLLPIRGDNRVAMFDNLKVGQCYSRPELADLWDYKGYQAIARGVVTPAGTRNIIIFVTQEKQKSAQQYQDRLSGDVLYWEGPTDHFAEARMLRDEAGDRIHVFYRAKHHSDFEYMGRAKVLDCDRRASSPSRFKLKLLDAGA